jgi:hypothetical protein
MQAQPARHISPEVQAIRQTVPSANRAKRNSEDLSSRSSTSSWTEEPVTTINMDIMTGHLILVCRDCYKVLVIL